MKTLKQVYLQPLLAFIHEMINVILGVVNSLLFVFLLAAVSCNNRRWEDGARTEVERQRDQSGQGSQRQSPHTGQCSHKTHSFHICMCVSVVF